MELTDREIENVMKYKKRKPARPLEAIEREKKLRKDIIKLSAAGVGAPVITERLRCNRGFVYEVRMAARRQGLW